MEKLITIITPLYNKVDWLHSWAEGLAKQTFLGKMKILVVDNHSEDGSWEKIQQLSEQFNLPTTFIRNETNMGLLYSTKLAYDKLDTKYWCVLDADDYYISPLKVQKAVEFLEEHEDYSCYACNQILESKSGQRYVAFPQERPSMTFEQLKEAPHFQTASATFRNFFTKDLLDAIQKHSQGEGVINGDCFSADAFCHLLAFRFGKVYYDNALDSCWRFDIGFCGTMSEIEKNYDVMRCQYTFFEFYRQTFTKKMDANSYCLLVTFLRFYQNLCKGVMQTFCDYSANEWQFTKSPLNDTDKLRPHDKSLRFLINELFNYCAIIKDLKNESV